MPDKEATGFTLGRNSDPEELDMQKMARFVVTLVVLALMGELLAVVTMLMGGPTGVGLWVRPPVWLNRPRAGRR